MKLNTVVRRPSSVVTKSTFPSGDNHETGALHQAKTMLYPNRENPVTMATRV